MKKSILIFLIFIKLSLLFSQEYHISNSTFNIACNAVNNDSINMKLTLGETLIGNCSNSLYNAILGFEYLVRNISFNGISGKITLYTIDPPAGEIEDVLISCGVNNTNPDSEGNYILMLDPGTYSITASLNGYTEVSLNNIVVSENIITENIDITLLDWEALTGYYSMVIFAQIEKDGFPFSGGNNNLAAAFGPNYDNDCRSLGEWNENPNQFWSFNIKSSINDQEIISFRIYDAVFDTIYTCNETYEFENNQIIGTPFEPILLTVSSQPYINNFRITKIENGILLNWDSNGTNFNIYRSNDPYSGFTQIGSTTELYYIDSNISNNEKCFYYIKAEY